MLRIERPPYSGFLGRFPWLFGVLRGVLGIAWAVAEYSVVGKSFLQGLKLNWPLRCDPDLLYIQVLSCVCVLLFAQTETVKSHHK